MPAGVREYRPIGGTVSDTIVVVRAGAFSSVRKANSVVFLEIGKFIQILRIRSASLSTTHVYAHVLFKLASHDQAVTHRTRQDLKQIESSEANFSLSPYILPRERCICTCTRNSTRDQTKPSRVQLSTLKSQDLVARDDCHSAATTCLTFYTCTTVIRGHREPVPSAANCYGNHTKITL